MGTARLSASQREALRIAADQADHGYTGGAWSTNRNDPAAGFVAAGSAAGLERRGLVTRLRAYGAIVPTPAGRVLLAEWAAASSTAVDEPGDG